MESGITRGLEGLFAGRHWWLGGRLLPHRRRTPASLRASSLVPSSSHASAIHGGQEQVSATAAAAVRDAPGGGVSQQPAALLTRLT